MTPPPHPQGNGKPGDVAESEMTDRRTTMDVDSFDANGLAWAVSRWDDEVKHRPLVNVHRRTLDDTWRQVIRYFGGDPDKVVGPNHDTLHDNNYGKLLSAAPVPEAGQGLSDERIEKLAREHGATLEDDNGMVPAFYSIPMGKLVPFARALLSPAPAQAQAPVAPPANWRELLGEQPVSTPPQSAQLIEPANGLEKGSAVCPTLHGNLLEIEPNDRRHQEGNRGTGEEEQRGADGERGDAVRTGSAESGARGGNAVQHEVAEERGTGNGAAERACALEAKAREIYDSWKDQPYWKPWVVGGNSSKQDHARRLAALPQGQQTEQGSRNG